MPMVPTQKFIDNFNLSIENYYDGQDFQTTFIMDLPKLQASTSINPEMSERKLYFADVDNG